MTDLGPYITNQDGTRTYPILKQTGGGGGINQLTGDVLAGPGGGSQAATLAAIIAPGTFGDSTHVPQITIDSKGRITIVTNVGIPGLTATSMPKASDVGILANGTDQTSNLNSVFSNASYAGIIMDYVGGGMVTVTGSVNCQGKLILFYPGSYFGGGAGTGRIFNHIHGAGDKQKCYDIGTSGLPTITIDPIGTTHSYISPWAFGANDSGGDVARCFQATSDCCIRNGAKISRIVVPTATYVLGSPWNLFNWNSGGASYVFFLLTIEGENSFSSADGFGSVLNFSSRKNSFGIGIHQGKGVIIKNIKLIGGFNYSFPGAYTFYTTPFTSITDGVSRDTTNSPNSAVVIDPYGPSIPSDGGWPGNDAYGISLSTYYRGNTNGSTGTELEDIFISDWVIGVITSPSAQTVNAELITAWKIQIQNVKIGFVSCQPQEKLNVVRHVESWGVCGCVFATNLGYGANSPGSWWVEDVNMAGFSHTYINNSQGGFFPSFFSNIYAESLGRFGVLSSNNGTIVQDATINFAYYNNGGAFAYLDAEISGQGMTFVGCQFRQYGTNLPITINALNGPIYFRDCSFETVPFYNQDYSVGFCAFSNCNVGNSANQLGAMDLQTVTGTSLSNTFSYGNIKINIAGKILNVLSGVAGFRMPVNRNNAGYLVTITVSTYHQAVITCSSDELNRVFVGDVICGETNGSGTGIRVLGIVTQAGSGTFTINNIPPWVVSGTTYYLYLWAQLRNLAFTGDQTSGSNQITNVTLIAGDLANFVPGSIYGGYMKCKTLQQTDGWQLNMFRILVWNPGTSTLTIDRQSTANLTHQLFTNTDAAFDPGTPTILAGAGAGTSPTVSITKGTDRTMQVSVLTGSGTPTGLVATITFSVPFAGGYIPSIHFSPANAAAAALNGATEVYMDSTRPDSFTINSGSSALSNATTYLWNVEAI